MKFGTDGIRGPAGTYPIDLVGAASVGRAALAWARSTGEDSVLVARDTRPSGAQLAEAVCEAIASAGGLALDAGVLSSPGLAAAVEGGVGARGVMITASHNPAADNGFKLLGPGGKKPTVEQTAYLEGLLTEPVSGRDGGRVEAADTAALQVYVASFLEALGSVDSLSGKHVVVDLANGAAQCAVDLLKQALPETTLTFIGDGDGLINDGVGSQSPALLQQAVLQLGADAGIAVDGDADRLLLVTETGDIVHGDAVAWLLTTGGDHREVAVTVMTNAAFESSLPGVRVVRTAVGDRFLAEAMSEQQLPLGCEQSGHILFASGLPGGDGLFAGLQTLSYAFGRWASASAAFSGFVPFPSALTKVRISRRPSIQDDPEMAALVTSAEERLGEGRVFLRYSGTEPVLRILVEGRDPERVASVSDDLTTVLRGVLQ